MSPEQGEPEWHSPLEEPLGVEVTEEVAAGTETTTGVETTTAGVVTTGAGGVTDATWMVVVSGTDGAASEDEDGDGVGTTGAAVEVGSLNSPGLTVVWGLPVTVEAAVPVTGVEMVLPCSSTQTVAVSMTVS